MKMVKVGAAVLNQTPRDWTGNYDNIVNAINQAKDQNVAVLCLPEACITGYGLEDDLFCNDLTTRAFRYLEKIADECRDIIVSVGLPVRYNNSLYAAVATIADGHILGLTCKQHLAGDGIHYEPRHFKPWPSGVVGKIHGVETACEYPIGDIYFNISGVKIGYEICEDAWVARRPGIRLAQKGIDIILNPSGSHFSFGKLNIRKNFVVDGSRAFNCTYIYSNLVGLEAGRAIYDGGAMIASGGSMLAIGKRFTYEDVLLTTAFIDIDTTRTQQVRSASFEPAVCDVEQGQVKFVFDWGSMETIGMNPPVKQEWWENCENTKHEECTRAIGLALMDYMRKSHTNGFVISLSGGADSAMVTYLCKSGIELGCLELGDRKFMSKYAPHLGIFSSPRVKENFIRELITTAYQSTAQSSETTRRAANCLAHALGVKHYELNVETLVNGYRDMFAKAMSHVELSFDNPSYALVLQNLQARVRSPAIWMFANLERKLLLTTSNMSEAAVGYATMDGDTSGCVAPIAGLPKCYIREYLRYVETQDCPEMELINKQAPTAELMPKEFKQTDETDLMPYDLLHRIEGMVVKNRYSPREIYSIILREDKTKYYSNEESDLLIDRITKFFRLFSINQWKRERYALSFHMDDHNLDPRTWCRTPILTGAYEEELLELWMLYSAPRKKELGLNP